jgi:preprotein translocase subunit SecD
MKSIWAAVAGVIAALAVGALVVVVLFSDRIGEYLPGFLQPAQVGGGPQVVLELQPDGVELAQAVDETIKIVQRRLNDLGARSSVWSQGNDRIVVELPKAVNVNRVVEVATWRGKLEFRLIDQSMTPEQAMRGKPPDGSEVLYARADKTPYLIEKYAAITSRDLTDAQAGFDQRTNEPVVSFRFNAAGTRKFARVTQENVGRPFAIVLDNEVISVPVIREPIVGGSGQISGSFTVEQANDMAILLRSGELPGQLRVIEIRTP